jgi:hypothetical protein
MEKRQARGLHEFQGGYRLCKISRSTVSKATAQPSEKLTWEEVRLRATKLGIPAWALAEDLAFHQDNGELVVSEPIKK